MRARLSVEFDTGRHTDQTDVNLVIRTPRRWHTDTGGPFGGAVHGWNLRVGRRYTGPCLTLLAHTRPAREAERCVSS